MKKSGTSTFAAGSEGSHSPQAGPELQQEEMFALSPSPKSTPSARPSSGITGPECPSSPTSESSTTKASATCLRQATPASPSRLPGSKKARQMTVTSGRTCLKSLSAKDPLGAFLKTLVVTSRWASTKCWLTWKTKATPQGRLLFQLAPSTPRTDATGSGLWATPRTTDGTGGPNKLDEKGRRVSQTNPDLVFGAKLADQVRMWPTPTVQDSNKATKKWREDHQNNLTAAVFNPEKMFPTPTARDWKGGYTTNALTRKDGKSRATDSLENVAMGGVGAEKYSGQLNPTWVEWLMGFPIGWTDLKPSAMYAEASWKNAARAKPCASPGQRRRWTRRRYDREE